MTLYFEGLLLGVCAFLSIGLFHPIVIKGEYYFGVRIWWAFLVVGVACAVSALFVENLFFSAMLSIVGFSSLWGIGEVFHQRKRVQKGWFPMNPKRAHEYEEELNFRFHSKKFHERVRQAETAALEKAITDKEKNSK